MTEPAWTFRPLRSDDFPLLVRWFNAPHVAPWFSRRTMDDLVDEYAPALRGEVPIHGFVAMLDERPVGFMEHMRFGDFPDAQALYGVDDPRAANCDVCIGEADVAHRGLGASLIRAFLERVVFADPSVPRVVIDPVPDNSIAIRAYEKVGFRFARAVPEDGEGNGLYLLELSRDELSRPHPLPWPVVRPARPTELQVARAIDEDACLRYAEVGLSFDFPDDHPFAANETARWRAAAERGRMLFACDDGVPVGFAAFDRAGEVPFLHQLSVRRDAMGRGVGGALLERVKRWSVREGELWLTTYASVAWNAPYYERRGFVRVAEADAPPAVRDVVAVERAHLPRPGDRVVMRWRREGASITA